VGEVLGPLGSNFFKHIWWDGQLGATSVDNGWVRGVFTWFLHSFTSIVHTLTLKSPGSKPILEILESFEALSSTNDLGRVVSAEKSIWGLTHLSGSNTETDNCLVDDAVVLKGPQIMELLFLHIFMWGKSEDSIGVVTEALGLVEGEELEESAFILFNL